MLSLTKIILTFTVVSICSTILLMKPVYARDYKVNLIATIDNGPALESVEWTVYRNGNEPVKTVTKHLAHVTIPAGKYKAVARLVRDRSVIRSRNFYVKNNTQVVVPMD